MCPKKKKKEDAPLKKEDAEEDFYLNKKPQWRCVECKEWQYHTGEKCYVKKCKAARRYLNDEPKTLKKERMTMKAAGE